MYRRFLIQYHIYNNSSQILQVDALNGREQRKR
jgi:hypothetical protein